LLQTNGFLKLTIKQIESLIKGKWRPTYEYSALACEYGMQSQFPDFTKAENQNKVEVYLIAHKPEQGYDDSIMPILSICFGPYDSDVFHRINGTASENNHSNWRRWHPLGFIDLESR